MMMGLNHQLIKLEQENRACASMSLAPLAHQSRRSRTDGPAFFPRDICLPRVH